MQFKAEHSIWHSCQLITLKRGNSSNSFDFKEVYSLYRFTEKNGSNDKRLLLSANVRTFAPLNSQLFIYVIASFFLFVHRNGGSGVICLCRRLRGSGAGD